MRESKDLDLETSAGPMTFTVRAMDGASAIKFFGWFTKRAGVGLSAMTSASEASTIAGIITGFSDADFEHIAKEFCRVTTVGDKVLDYKAFSELFRGCFWESIKLIVFAFGVTFGNFSTVPGDLASVWDQARG